METSACKSSRFKEPVSDALEEEMRTNAVPDKTKAVTAWGIRIYTEWAAHRASKTSSDSEVRDLETPLLSMRSEELSYWLGKFVLEARKKNGDEYPPKTLYQIVCCFKRHFEANGIHSFNLLNPQEPAFGNFRHTLDAEMQSTASQRSGNPNQAG